MPRFAAALYLIAGLAASVLCVQSLLMAVWGAPTHWIQYAGLLGSLLLVVGALGMLITGRVGQTVCATGIVGLGFLLVPAAAALVPVEDGRIAPLAYGVELGYVVFAGAVLQYPKKMRGAALIFSILLLAIVGFAGVTACRRWQAGVYNRPMLVAFLGRRTPAPLRVPDPFGPLFRPSLLAPLAAAGLGGPLAWCGSAGFESRRTRLVVVATARIPAEMALPYPRDGTIIYLWNGDRWSVFPAGAACYPAHATLRTDGMVVEEDAQGGESASGLFPWR